jgi:hypothetical protein
MTIKGQRISLWFRVGEKERRRADIPTNLTSCPATPSPLNAAMGMDMMVGLAFEYPQSL